MERFGMKGGNPPLSDCVVSPLTTNQTCCNLMVDPDLPRLMSGEKRISEIETEKQ